MPSKDASPLITWKYNMYSYFQSQWKCKLLNHVLSIFLEYLTVNGIFFAIRFYIRYYNQIYLHLNILLKINRYFSFTIRKLRYQNSLLQREHATYISNQSVKWVSLGLGMWFCFYFCWKEYLFYMVYVKIIYTIFFTVEHFATQVF